MIGGGLSTALAREGMSVDWVRNGGDAAIALTNGGHGLVLLDLGLPDQSGLDVLRAARRAGNKLPIIVVTARDGVDDKILGLDIGADDYIVKPFDIGELIARIRAVLRRHAGAAQSILAAGEIELDLASHELRYRSISAALPAREFALMHAFVERPGVILSKSQIEDRIYGWGDEVESNAVDVLIHSIRKKFDKDIILNVRGAGWMVSKASP